MLTYFKLAPSLFEQFLKSFDSKDAYQVEIIDNKLFLIIDKISKINTNIPMTCDITDLISKDNLYIIC